MSALPIVLVHGGGFDGRCWEPVQPHLGVPSLAVDLPGRGRHPAPLSEVTLAACAASVRADIEAAGFHEVALVGHSLAGCSMPAIVEALHGRVRHAVFVACTVPSDGRSAFDMLDHATQQRIADAGGMEPRPMDAAMARVVLGPDLTPEQFAWCETRLVAEAPRLTTESVDLSPLRGGVKCTWIRTLRDAIVPAERQREYAAAIGAMDVIDLDAGHMCMVSHPVELASLLRDIVEA